MTKTSDTVLILGANGRFGHHVAQAFAAHGWKVIAQTRTGKLLHEDLRDNPLIEHCAQDLNDTVQLIKQAAGSSVIVNGLNPPYKSWRDELPIITETTIALAEALSATIILPGNVYNFGSSMPPQLDEKTPQGPTNIWGELRCNAEAMYRRASRSGVQTLVLRIGDFLQSEPSGNWFDSHMTASLHKDVFIYPGDPTLPHAYGYLPDVARAVVALATRREKLGHFEDIPFKGHTLTGNEMKQYSEQCLGRPLKLKGIPWPMVKLMSLFNGDMRGVLAMRYLWDTPHALDNAKFEALFPDFHPTPKREMFDQLLSCHTM